MLTSLEILRFSRDPEDILKPRGSIEMQTFFEMLRFSGDTEVSKISKTFLMFDSAIDLSKRT